MQIEPWLCLGVRDMRAPPESMPFRENPLGGALSKWRLEAASDAWRTSTALGDQRLQPKWSIRQKLALASSNFPIRALFCWQIGRQDFKTEDRNMRKNTETMNAYCPDC